MRTALIPSQRRHRLALACAAIATLALPWTVVHAQVRACEAGYTCAASFATPLLTAVAVARMAMIGLAFWAAGRAATAAIGGDGGAWLKAFLSFFAVVMIYNPLWITNTALRLGVSRFPRDMCTAGISLCPSTSFGPP